MKTRIVQIGNSRGIRIPKVMLEQSGLGEEVELKVKKEGIIITPIKKARAGWSEAFRQMAQNKDDQLLYPDILANAGRWDEEEWTW